VRVSSKKNNKIKSHKKKPVAFPHTLKIQNKNYCFYNNKIDGWKIKAKRKRKKNHLTPLITPKKKIPTNNKEKINI